MQSLFRSPSVEPSATTLTGAHGKQYNNVSLQVTPVALADTIILSRELDKFSHRLEMLLIVMK